MSVSDYLWRLRELCEALQPHGTRAMVVLAAAVSDFYIPVDAMSEHKIQSGQHSQHLVLHLAAVPKMLGEIKQHWCPEATLVSFKLETDPAILFHKAEGAIKK